jgi:hypothetical protein
MPGPQDSLVVFSWNMAVHGGNLLAFLEEAVGVTCSGAETQVGEAYPHFVLLAGSYRTTEGAYSSDHHGRVIWLRFGSAPENR